MTNLARSNNIVQLDHFTLSAKDSKDFQRLFDLWAASNVPIAKEIWVFELDETVFRGTQLFASVVICLGSLTIKELFISGKGIIVDARTK
ncbi:MAG: hypothetical protein ACTSW1_10555 [Candidatus Hodarchaeales archaeon]